MIFITPRNLHMQTHFRVAFPLTFCSFGAISCPMDCPVCDSDRYLLCGGAHSWKTFIESRVRNRHFAIYLIVGFVFGHYQLQLGNTTGRSFKGTWRSIQYLKWKLVKRCDTPQFAIQEGSTAMQCFNLIHSQGYLGHNASRRQLRHEPL